jgi:uncharacterized protein YjbI with pentapeptide repeats
LTFFGSPAFGAGIQNWKTGLIIPGTEGITPHTVMSLERWNTSSHNLQYADFSGGLDLRDIYLNICWLDYARFNQANLSESIFQFSTLTNTDLTQANLTYARFWITDLTNANLTQANLTYTSFGDTTFANANFTDAVLQGASFGGAIYGASPTATGLTKEQLYSSASYKSKNLSEIDLSFNNLSGWDFTDQNISNAYFDSAVLTGANLTHADLTGTRLVGADMRGATGLTPSQVSSANAINLIRPDGTVGGLDLTQGWDTDTYMHFFAVRDYDNAVNPAAVHIQDGMVMGLGSVIRMVLDADAWDSTISFDPGVPVTINGGALQLYFANGVDLNSQIGRTFQLFDWTGVSPVGTFDVQVQDPELWNLDNLYTTGYVTYVPEPGTLGLFLSLFSGWLIRRRQ